MGVRRWVAAVLCVPLLGMAGCSDDDPKAEPEDQETPSASTSPTPSGPSIPPEAQGTDEASAKAFVRHWFAVLSDGMRDGDLDELRGLSSSSCKSCTQLAGAIADVYDSGGRFETQGWFVERFVPQKSSAATAPNFLLRTRHTNRDLYDGQGKLIDSQPEQLVGMRVALSRNDGRWQVERLEELT